MSDNLSAFIKAAKSGDSLAFAKLLTQIETLGSHVLSTPELLSPSGFALRVGITGPPGAGKSTLMNELLSHFLSEKKRIGVIAVDPTSPHSSGAILGDRIRYGENALDERVFFRSIGTRGSLGGLNSSVYLMLRAFDACGFDLVLIETVGVGQVEVEIMNVADLVTLVLVPESGDSIQAMKAGILEIADVVVVNKCDRPGADLIKREIENELSQSESRSAIKVFSTTAATGGGVKELAAGILELSRLKSKDEIVKKRNSPKRLQSEALALSKAKIEEDLRKKFSSILTAQDLVKALQ